MHLKKKWMRLRIMMLWSVLLLLCGGQLYAQTDQQQARMYLDNKQYDKAIELYQKLYEEQPAESYNDYLQALVQDEKYKDAEKLVNQQLNREPVNALYYQDLGLVFDAEGKKKKARDEYDKALQLLNGDDMLTQKIASTFIKNSNDEYAIKTYERAKAIMGNSYMYGPALARLYAKEGNLELAVTSLLDMGPIHLPGTENTEAMLLELTNGDAQKLQRVQKILIKKINDEPDNSYYGDLLTWLFTQKGDWDGALIQIEAIDLRNREDGHRLMEFANNAVRAKQYAIAVKAYDDVIEKGKDKPYYMPALAEKLYTAFIKLKSDPNYTQLGADTLAAQYADFMGQFPALYATQTASDYAMLEAQYNNNPQKGIEILQKAIDMPSANPEFVGACKLQLGDYYILAGKIWDASLTYSQVDKSFKEDAMGEDARFRNAKLAFYRGDFDWAQQQLSVLKASTSELIANDALYLSVLITENVTADSNFVPLRRFAYADLLLFQNKDKEAEALLDSISTAFPQHPLNDDILMLRTKIAEKHHDYAKALDYLQQIIKQYGQDVLGDDAMYKTAEIYEDDLHQNDQAKHYYEQLILNYPGSTYVQTARKKLEALNNNTLP